MFLCFWKNVQIKIHKIIKSITKKSSPEKHKRKDIRSPRNCLFILRIRNAETFFFAPLQASLTLEAAIVVPLFLFAMITALQYGRCMETAVQFGTALADTGKMMAAAAYVTEYGGDGEGAAAAAAGALSAAAAQYQVFSKTSDTSCVRNANMLLSSFLKEDEQIRLVLTYQLKTPISSFSLPWNFFIQCAQVRAWTGRSIAGKSGEDGDEDGSQEYVYVAITGSVYHEDPECTHLKLSVKETTLSELGTLRNNNGGIYHICERCGNFGSSTVYITKEGNRYHSSLSCSGLKRTVRKVTKDQIGAMRCCSKCQKQ